ncbi:MAG: aldo/keto reductase [Verrucomicrobiota bacterium]
MERRKFLNHMVTGAAATAIGQRLVGAPISTSGSDRLGKILPTRVLGSSGEPVTALALGGHHLGKAVKQSGEPMAEALVEASLEEGIRFFDTAYNYHDGMSEEMYGKYLTPKYRDDVFIMSKCEARPPKPDPMTQLETSLKRMKTDYIDLWMVHTVVSAEDAAKRVPEMYAVFEQAREKGLVRYFGVSGHVSNAAMLEALKVTADQPMNAMLMPMNPVDFVSQDSFIKNVLPVELEQGVASLAMKTMNDGYALRTKLNGKTVVPDRLSKEENQWFTLSLPVSSWVSGMENPEQVKENAELLRRFTQLSETDRLEIAKKVLDVADEMDLQPYRKYNVKG